MRMYKFQTRFKTLLFFLCFINLLDAQEAAPTGSIKGTVKDEVSAESLPYCNVYIKALGIGTTTDEAGDFLLEKVPEGNHLLTISFIGYNEKTIPDIRVRRNKVAFHSIDLSENILAFNQVEIKAFKYENLSSLPNSTFSLSREEIFRSPASNGNIFRAISVLPGVQSGGGSFAALAVRGQGTEENATYVDEFPVFELSHLAGGRNGFDDPNGGRFSIFGPRAVKGLVLQTGGFSALYGRRSSSYMELQINEGNPENPEIDVIGSLTGPSASYSGPLGKKAQIYSSLRYQNFVPALTLTNQADLGFPSFVDLTVKITSSLNEKNDLTILSLFNPEQFKRTAENVVKDDNIKYNYENNFLADVNNAKGLFGIKLATRVGQKANWTNLAYVRFKSTDTKFGLAYPFETSDGVTPDYEDIPVNENKGFIDNTEREIGLRSIYQHALTDRVMLKAGVDVARMELNHNRTLTSLDTIYSFYRSSLPVNQAGQNFLILQPENYNSTFEGGSNNISAYTNFFVKVSSKLSANIGLRMDYTGFSEQTTISPRFNLNYSLSERTNLTFATGIFYQDPLNIQISDNNGNSLEQEKAVHFISGIKHYFHEDLKFSIEGYYKSFSNLITRPNPSVNAISNIGEGEAYGVDISLIKRLSNKFNGQISYSYSQSTRDNNDGIGLYDHLYSQPHILNLLIGYQPTPNWIISWKLRYSTGQPTNSSIIFENIFEGPTFNRFGQELTGRHDLRNDYFFGFDFRVDRRFQLKKIALTAFLDIQNVTNRENASTRTFYEITGANKPQALGILPTVGWRFEF